MIFKLWDILLLTSDCNYKLTILIRAYVLVHPLESRCAPTKWYQCNKAYIIKLRSVPNSEVVYLVPNGCFSGIALSLAISNIILSICADLKNANLPMTL